MGTPCGPGYQAFLDACLDPALMRIGLRDAPGVLGWEEWREIGNRHGLGLVTGGLGPAMDAGADRPQPTSARSRTCSSPRSPRRRC